MARLFFTLSGEHETLPTSELKAILETEGHEYRIVEKLDQVIRLETSMDAVKTLKQRAALTRLCALELFCCSAEIGSIVRSMRSTPLGEVLKENESFAVRVKHVKEYSSGISGMILEGKLGELVLESTTRARVDLKTPYRTLIGVLTSGKFVFGLKLDEIAPKPFVQRRPRKKPFFHPSAMPAKLARCMVNLARPKAGELVLDPFCGTGSMLIEAALIECRVVGLDAQRRMARGTRRNLTYFKVKPEGVIVADARKPPITDADCIVTDPPYGISSTTLKRTMKQIVEELLVSASGMLGGGQRICMAAPKTLRVGHMGSALGFKHLESHFVYVHRSLTREIVVFEKVAAK